MVEDVLVQMACVIRFLHEIGLSHNDIFLRNILVREDGGVGGPLKPLQQGCRVFLIDYGLSTMGKHDPPIFARIFRKRLPSRRGQLELEEVDTAFKWRLEYDKFCLGQ